MGLWVVLLLGLANLALAATPPTVEALLALTRDGQTEALHGALDALMGGPVASLDSREARLLDYARRLRDETPSTAGHAALARLVNYRSRLFDPSDDPRSGLRIPRYRVAAAARGTLNLWRKQTLKQGLGDLTQQAEQALRDPVVLGQTLRRASQETALELYSRSQSLPPAQALLALQMAADHPDLGSAAVLAVGELASRHPPARQLLLDWLGDPRLGSSAAEALARLDDPDLLAIVAQRYRAEPPLRPRLLLLLTRSQTPGALALLRDLAEDPITPPTLRASLQPWLAN